MQLRFSRLILAFAMLGLFAVEWVAIMLALKGGIEQAMIVMAVLLLLTLVILGAMLRPPAIAGIESDMLRVGRQRVHLSDVLRIATAQGALVFAIRARDADGFWAGSMGERNLALKLWRVDGGRKAAQAFAALVDTARKDVAPLPVAEPPAPRLPVRPRRDGIDPDVRPVDPVLAASATRPRAAGGFGRKGL
jgi:hypothetical protein